MKYYTNTTIAEMMDRLAVIREHIQMHWCQDEFESSEFLVLEQLEKLLSLLQARDQERQHSTEQ